MTNQNTGPTWYREAQKDIGVREVPGSRNSPTIMGWARRLGSKVLGIAYNADSVPWCGVAMAHWIEQRGFAPPPIAIRAMAWATWGRDLGLKDLYLGSVVVFKRPGGGHVGMCSGFTDTHIRVLGGNQSDAVNHMWLERSRLVAQRWPTTSQQIPTIAPKFASRTGPVSTNEA